MILELPYGMWGSLYIIGQLFCFQELFVFVADGRSFSESYLSAVIQPEDLIAHPAHLRDGV